MGKKWIFLTILAVIIGGGYYLYSQGEIGEPTVDLNRAKVDEITLTTTKLDVRITVHNPNPVGVSLDRIDYDVYFIQNGSSEFLGEGSREKNIHIEADGDTTFTVPFEASNMDAIRTLAQFVRDKVGMDIKIDGSVFVDLKITNLEVPFSEIRSVSV